MKRFFTITLLVVTLLVPLRIAAEETLLFQDDFNRADGTDFGPEWKVFYRAITACQTPWPVPAIVNGAFVGKNENANGTMRLVKEFESTITRITFDYIPVHAEQSEVGIGVSVLFYLKDSYLLQAIRSYYGDDAYGWGEEQPDSAFDSIRAGEYDSVPRTMTVAVDSIAQAVFGITDPTTVDYTEVWIGMHANRCGAVAEGVIDNVKIYGIASTDVRPSALRLPCRPSVVPATRGRHRYYDLRGRPVPVGDVAKTDGAAGYYCGTGTVAESMKRIVVFHGLPIK